ncbi:hypothetical protein EVAR_73551_1 [Eumeta japonica]|uniref:Uncharacterized protein n=1 Tax=Eumeta variegata TaxID=151549 RepID=A0A4C1T9V6_EUMVA|nr:hypothetical protein EVAR_73551_1 [Eumeta japonica]
MDTTTSVKSQSNEISVINPIQNLPIELQNDQKRRSSSRSIKRKRFDDEIVEYSINLPSRSEQSRVGRLRTTSQTYLTSVQPPPSVSVPTNTASVSLTGPAPDLNSNSDKLSVDVPTTSTVPPSPLCITSSSGPITQHNVINMERTSTFVASEKKDQLSPSKTRNLAVLPVK